MFLDSPMPSMWLFDVGDLENVHPISGFYTGENESPCTRSGGRFGAHQFQEHMDGTLVLATGFSGGSRIVDISDPLLPQEVRSYVPHPGTGQAVPRSNDVDGRGLISLLDRLDGLDILAMEG